MLYTRLGTSQLEVSNICLGTMTFGQQNSEREGHQQLDYALERGVNFIDTAEMYPVPARAATQSATETIVGRWLAGQSARRDRIVLATKVAGNSAMTWIRGGGRLDRANIQRAVEDSLRRLQTDTIDLYQVHWPDRYVPKFGGLHFEESQYYANASIGETVAAMAELIQSGKIRTYGLSNETPWGTCQYLHEADRQGAPRPVSIQNAFSLLNRTYESQMAEVSFHERIPLLAYSPLAFGFLTGKYRHGVVPPDSRIALFPEYPQRYLHKVNREAATEAYAELAGSGGLTALALRFVASRPFCASTIIGATRMDQLAENIDAFSRPLTADEASAIDAIHWRYPNPCP